MGFVGTWLVTALAVGAAIWIVPGIQVVGGDDGDPPLLSLGIFSLVLNAFMLELASYLARNITHAGIVIESFGSAFVGAIVIAIVTAVISGIVR